MRAIWIVPVIASILILGFSIQDVNAEMELFGIANQLPGQITQNTPGILYSIDINTGAGTIIGPIGFNKCDAMDIDNSGTLYATCNRPPRGPNVLITIDPFSGAGTEIGLTGLGFAGFGDNAPKDISFRNSDGELFGYTHRCRTNFGLMTIDIDTGQATGISPSGRCTSGNGLAFSFDDILYHMDQRFLSTINQVDGTLTSVASSGIGRATAMEFNPDDGLLYAAIASINRNHRDLVTVDTITGKFTTIGITVNRLTALAFGEISLTEALQNVIDELQNIIDNNPGTPLADKLEDAKGSVQTAINQLNKTPPDNQATAGNIEGAAGSLEDAIKDEGLDQTQGEELINQLLDISRQVALNAIDTANNTLGSDLGKIASANAALTNGDTLRTPPTSFGDFKTAAAEYKVAIAEAEGALP